MIVIIAALLHIVWFKEIRGLHFSTISKRKTSKASPLFNDVGLNPVDSISNAYRNSIKQTISKLSTGGWFPIGAPSTFDDVLPFEIEIANRKLVVWKSPIDFNTPTNGWSVMSNICPHRLAPLSKGRVDSVTGCIECPYHGWQFDTTGKCASVPQLEPDLQSKLQLPSTAATSLPVYVTADLLWAFVPLPQKEQEQLGAPHYFPTLPDEEFLELQTAPVMTVMRDLPYSFDFLVENFMDVAHLPFAHHKLQSWRADAQPVAMTALTDISNTTHCEVSFTDTVQGKVRQGITSFRPPCYYHFRIKNPITGLFKITAMIFCVPISPGKARAIFTIRKSPPPAKVSATAVNTTNAKKKNSSSGERNSKLKLLTDQFQWLFHWFVNKFMDSDIWVHDQELVARSGSSDSSGAATDSDTSASTTTDSISNNSSNISNSRIRNLPPLSSASLSLQKSSSKYVLVSRESDLGVIAWRKWWTATGMSQSSIFGPAKHLSPIPYLQQIDRYENHVKYCRYCQSALKKAQFIQKWCILTALLPMVLTNSFIYRSIVVLSYIVAKHLSNKIIVGLVGGSELRGVKLSAAQMAPYGMK